MFLKDKLVLKNVSFLFLLQGSTYLFPLVSIPYIIKTLGFANFGVVAFAQAIAGICLIVVDYGFGLTSTAKVAVCNGDKRMQSRILSITLLTQLMLIIICFVVLAIMSAIIPKLAIYQTSLLLAYLSVAATMFFPVWFFQGIEKMSFILIPSLVGKIAVLIMLFAFVHFPDDFNKVIVIQASTSLFSAIPAAFFLYRKGYFLDYKVRFKDCLDLLKEGWPVFLSLVGVSFYTYANTIILAFFSSTIVVGYFSTAEKVVRLFKEIVAPFSQSAFPRVNQLVVGCKQLTMAFVKNYMVILCSITSLAGLLLLFFSDTILKLLFGSENHEVVTVIQIFSLLPLLNAIGNTFGTLILIPFGHKNVLSRIYLTAGIFNLFVCVAMTMWMGITGTSISVMLTEFIVVCMLYRELMKNKLIPFDIISKNFKTISK